MWPFTPRRNRRASLRRKPPSCRPRVQALEDRCLLSSGALDPAFGSGGIVATAMGNFRPGANGDLLQSNGDIIVYGAGSNKSGRYAALARYTPGGSLDPTFGSGGTVRTSSAGSFTTYSVTRAVLQADGKIVALDVGVLVRYNADGSIDKTFGGKGAVALPGNVGMQGLLIQPNGDIVVCGYYFIANNESSGGYALFRYTSSGTLDPTFGSGGEVMTATEQNFNGSFQSLVLENGDLVAGGTSDSSVDFALARYTLSGSLDPTFGSGGFVITPAPPGTSNSRVNALLVQPNGQIVAVGAAWLNGGTPEWELARYNADGSLDNSFGASGIVTNSITPPTSYGGDIASGAALQSNGQIVVVGTGGWSLGGNWSPDQDVLEVGVYNPNGSPDASFGSGGFITQSYGTGASAGGVVIQPDGKIVVAGTANFNGSTTAPGTNQWMLARYMPSAAQIGSFTASPNPVASGSNVILTVSNITLADPSSTITQVAFYVEADGTETFLGYGTQSSAGVWTFTFTVNLASGSYTLIAQATDSDGIVGDPAALPLQVT